MDIRHATLDDLHGVHKLICELEDIELPLSRFKKTYFQNLSNENIHYMIIENQGQLIGFGSLHLQNLLHHSACIGEIQELIVSGSFKGQGLGSKLMNRLIKIGKEKGCELIEVCCNRSRTKSHEFYEHCGFSRSHYKFTLRLG